MITRAYFEAETSAWLLRGVKFGNGTTCKNNIMDEQANRIAGCAVFECCSLASHFVGVQNTACLVVAGWLVVPSTRRGCRI